MNMLPLLRFAFLVAVFCVFLPMGFAAEPVAVAPAFSLLPGSYETTQTVTITDDTSGAVIYYTTNGLAPTTSSLMYTGPVFVPDTMTLRAIAALPGAAPSTVTTSIYTIIHAVPPVFSLLGGAYSTVQTVTITDATPNAAIYYTTDGLAPTTSSTLYDGPVFVANSMTLRAVAAIPNAPASTVTTEFYTIVPTETPTFSVPAGTYQTSQTVAINDATPGATIYYTTTGLAPTTSSAVYTGPISVIGTTSLRAIAVVPNAPASPVATAVYTLVASTTPVNSPNSSSTFFGMVINHLLGGTGWPSLPVGTIRLWDTSTLWNDQNPASGTYNWGNMDRQLAIAKGNNSEVIFTFGGTPPWAIATNLTIESLIRSEGVVTVTTSQPHALYYNPAQPSTSQSQITIAGSADWSFNGTFYLTGTPTANTLTFAQSGPDTSSSYEGTLSAVCSGSFAPNACAEAPSNLSDWDEYLTQLTTHVGSGSIPYWELWNEPNMPDFWKGDPQRLVTMAEHAQKIIKAADSNAIIVSPGVTGVYADAIDCNSNPAFCGTTWINNWLALGGKDYIDIIGFHGYPADGKAPEQIQGAVDQLHQVMIQNEIGSLSIWDTESSWAKNSSYSVSDDQAGWVVRHLLLEQSMGVQRTFWYAYDNVGWGTLWDSATGLNSSGKAWGEVASWTAGTTLTQPCAASPTDATTFVCGYSGPDGYTAEALWNTTAVQTVAVPPQFVKYRDISGTVHPIVGGTVEISTSPIFLDNRLQVLQFRWMEPEPVRHPIRIFEPRQNPEGLTLTARELAPNKGQSLQGFAPIMIPAR